MNREKRLLQVCAVIALLIFLAWGTKEPDVSSVTASVGEEGEEKIVMQLPELPNGCEVASLSTVLEREGADNDKMVLWSQYLPIIEVVETEAGLEGGDPEEAYIGDATTQNMGWYCYELPLKKAADCFLKDRGSEKQAKIVSGLPFSALEKLLENGRWVVVWVTQDYELLRYSARSFSLPNGEIYAPWANLHCVVLCGRENGCYQVADPLRGWQLVETMAFWESFSSLGRRAMVIE